MAIGTSLHQLIEVTKESGRAAGKLVCETAGLVWRVAGESDSEDDMSLSSEEASDDDVPENKAQVLLLLCGLGALVVIGRTVAELGCSCMSLSSSA